MAKNTWTKKELERFRKTIQEKRESTLDIIESSRRTTESMMAGETVNAIYSSHMADAGSDQMEREKEFFWITRETTYLQYLDRALAMLDDGTFGICKECGEKIEVERLNEVPHTSTCYSCKVKSKRP
ncbi:MAG: TraR/DksA family transcriptional regulator [FCB group bacterium]|nr:TraR/DksA family transcriptional regulator [FCB group bacterium]